MIATRDVGILQHSSCGPLGSRRGRCTPMAVRRLPAEARAPSLSFGTAGLMETLSVGFSGNRHTADIRYLGILDPPQAADGTGVSGLSFSAGFSVGRRSRRIPGFSVELYSITVHWDASAVLIDS